MTKFLLALCLGVAGAVLVFILTAAPLRAEPVPAGGAAPPAGGALAADQPASAGPSQVKQVKLVNPIGGSEASPKGKTDVAEIIGTVIKGVLGIMGAVVLLIFVWATTGLILAAGNPEKIRANIQTIIWAAVGVLIVLSSYVILTAMLKTLGR